MKRPQTSNKSGTSPTQNTYAAAARLYTAGRYPEAITLARTILVKQPAHADALKIVAGASWHLGNLTDAEHALMRLREAQPRNVEFALLMADFLQATQRLEAAAAAYRAVLAIVPEHLTAYHKLGVVYAKMWCLGEAETAFRQALTLDPNCTDSLCALGTLLKRTGRTAEAESCLRQALKTSPHHPETLVKMAALDADHKRWREAAEALDKVLTLQPDYPNAPGTALTYHAYLCDWSSWDPLKEHFVQSARAGKAAGLPFAFLNFLDDPELQRQGIESHVRTQIPLLPNPFKPTDWKPHARLRIAYISPDFHDHPVAHLIADTLAEHQREDFEVVAVSLCEVNDAWRQRILESVDHYIDGTGSTLGELAQRLRAMDIDIAVDLAGHTRNGMPELFAFRIAPIQVSYLGFPGTLGAPFIDYVLADDFVIPESHERFYTEKIARLPHTFQVAARRKPAADWSPSRTELNLPEQGFVFCCFNNTYKLQPPIFDVWMRLLHRVPGSVLWLYAPNPEIEAHLKARASAANVDPSRLVFGVRLSLDRYLARYRFADLFLDTPTYNAGTTASDALWAGLPVVTVPGQSFAARMGGSLLRAAGLEDLIAPDLAAFEEIAYHLATDPAALAAIKTRLRNNQATAPLFDVSRSTRHLEAAYTQMFKNWQEGHPPTSFSVSRNV